MVFNLFCLIPQYVLCNNPHHLHPFICHPNQSLHHPQASVSSVSQVFVIYSLRVCGASIIAGSRFGYLTVLVFVCVCLCECACACGNTKQAKVAVRVTVFCFRPSQRTTKS